MSQPDCGEMALDIVDKLVRSSAVDVIVIDSVAALVPRYVMLKKSKKNNNFSFQLSATTLQFLL